ncbi:MAG: hypothetical protein ABMA26_02645 [Limisphaerales bacterium]
MKLVKVLAAVAFTMALSTSLALAADKQKELEGKLKVGGCCDLAKKEGKACPHFCCKEAAKDGKLCDKCNPPPAKKH